jgi:hypothetical protein
MHAELRILIWALALGEILAYAPNSSRIVSASLPLYINTI